MFLSSSSKVCLLDSLSCFMFYSSTLIFFNNLLVLFVHYDSLMYSRTKTNSNPNIFSLDQSHLTRLTSTIFKWLVLLPSHKLCCVLCCKQCGKNTIKYCCCRCCSKFGPNYKRNRNNLISCKFQISYHSISIHPSIYLANHSPVFVTIYFGVWVKLSCCVSQIFIVTEYGQFFSEGGGSLEPRSPLPPLKQGPHRNQRVCSLTLVFCCCFSAEDQQGSLMDNRLTSRR